MRAAFPLSALAWLAGCASPAAPAASTTAAAPTDESTAMASPAWLFLRMRHDGDGDGRIELREYTRGADAFQRLDADGNSVITAADFAAKWDGVPRIRARAEGASSGGWISMRAFEHGDGGPEVGDEAPLFELVSTSGEVIELASFRHEKPVALVFGSYT